MNYDSIIKDSHHLNVIVHQMSQGHHLKVIVYQMSYM